MRCKDCAGEGRPRPAPHPGPRCATHHRAKRTEVKERAWAARIWVTYGLDARAYWLLYEYQGRHCQICQRATGASKRLAVDHDHKTGEVRGLLCGPCNQSLGRMRDDPKAFLRAAEYLVNPPYRQMRAGEE